MDRHFRRLEKLFGKVSIGETAVSRFGKKYVNGIQGWQFPEEKLKEANRNGKLLTMDLDFPGNKCALNCRYCFAKAGEVTGTYYRPDKGDSPLSLGEIKSFLIEAREMGLESAKIIGYREAFENKDFFDFVDFASGQGIHLVVFTAAYTLGEKQFGSSLKKAIDFLAERNVSLMVKMHTLDRAEEDRIVGMKGYSEKRDKNLKALLDDGRFTEKGTTRLGIENVISTGNIEELLAIYEYFKIYRNVFVDIDPPMPIGRTGTIEEAEKAGLLPQEKLRELCVKTYRINQKHGIPIRGVSPYFGGDPCSQLSNGLYLTLSGKVFACCGSDEENGNIRKNSLKEIFENSPYRKEKQMFRHCPYREKKKIMTIEMIGKIEEELGVAKQGQLNY